MTQTSSTQTATRQDVRTQDLATRDPQAKEMQAKDVQAKERNGADRERPSMYPAVDVVEDATGLTLWVDMPGVPKDAIELKLDGDSLSISGDIAALDTPGLQPLYAEVRAGRYQRAFTLSRELETSRIEASCKNGVLQLRIPKAPDAQPRRIEVRGAA
jgi:HSP20 family molecular chaperone IbpA